MQSEQGRVAQAALVDKLIRVWPKRYPKLAKLLEHKHRLTDSPSHSIPPTFMETRNEPMPSVLPALTAHRFDVILMTPPPETSFDELRALDLGRVAATPGFVWLWVGSGARGNGIGLEKGRELLAAWGYRCVLSVISSRVCSHSTPAGAQKTLCGSKRTRSIPLKISKG